MDRLSFRFTTPFQISEVEVKGEKTMYLEGLISTTDIDMVNDLVTKKCLESMKSQLLSRNIKLDLEHEAFRGNSVEEKEINKTKIPAGKIIDATVVTLGKDRFGLSVKAEVNKHNRERDLIEGNLKDGFLDAYSIAYIPTATNVVNMNGKSVRVLDDVNLLNVALTGNPINTEAQNAKVFMKSIESLEDYKKEKKSNPEIEGMLEVKSFEAKDQAQFYVIDKIFEGKKLDSKELKLVKAVLDVADNKEEAAALAKKLMSKLSDGMKLDRKECTMLIALMEVKIDYSNVVYEEMASDIKSDLTHNNLGNQKSIEKEVINMSEEDNDANKGSGEDSKVEEEAKAKAEAEAKAKEEAEAKAKAEADAKAEEDAKKDEAEKEDLKAEVKSLTEKNAVLEKEMAEIKSFVKMPNRKSKTETKDKSADFEEKSRNPLDLI